MPRFPTRFVLGAIFLGLAALAAYWPGLSGGFFFDDGPSILRAPGVHMRDLSWDSLTLAWASGGAGPSGRPVAQLSFAFNHYLSGLHPWAFKVTNLIVHGLCALLVLGVVLELYRTKIEKSASEVVWLPLLVTGLWALHPLQLLPILHVVQRMTTLSALFLLAGFWLHIVARRQGDVKRAAILFTGAWGLAWPLSMLSKETGVLFPVFVLAWELLIRPKDVGALDRFAKIYAAALVVLAVGGMLYLALPYGRWVWAGYEFRSFDAVQRLLTEARVLWFYVGLAMWPRAPAMGLYHDDFLLSTNWLTPASTLPAVLGWLGVVCLVWVLRKRLPLIAFGLAWFLVGHLVESTVLPLEIAHEHRNYLPLLGLMLAFGEGLRHLLSRCGRSELMPAIGAVFIFLLTGITGLRAYQFGDDLRRTQAQAQDHPESLRSQYEAGMVIAGLPIAADVNSLAYKTARRHLERATALDAGEKMALLELLELDCKAGAGVNGSALLALRQRLATTSFAPGDQSVLYYLKESAVARVICLDREQVTGLFAAALGNPRVSLRTQSYLYSWLADYHWLREQDLPAAKQALGQALKLNPGSPSNRLKWAQLLWIGRDFVAARKLLLELRMEPLTSTERQTLEQLLAS